MPEYSPESILEKAQLNIEREVAGQAYIRGLIVGGGEHLREAFFPDVPPEESTEEALADVIRQTLDQLTYVKARPFGAMLRYAKIGEAQYDTPALRLGWATFILGGTVPEDWPADKAFPHLLVVSKEGLEMLNGFRSARGLVSVEELARKNRERWDRVVDAAMSN